MQPKLCTRCQFMVQPKSKLCSICGNRKFAAIEMEQAVAAPIAENNPADPLRTFMHDLADDVALTAEKSISAWRQIQKLIRG
jgi:hypothetical protein